MPAFTFSNPAPCSEYSRPDWAARCWLVLDLAYLGGSGQVPGHNQTGNPPWANQVMGPAWMYSYPDGTGTIL